MRKIVLALSEFLLIFCPSPVKPGGQVAINSHYVVLQATVHDDDPITMACKANVAKAAVAMHFPKTCPVFLTFSLKLTKL